MKRLTAGTILAMFLTAGAAQAAVVVERWGISGHLQHPNTLLYELAGEAGTVMRFDLSALPKGTKVYRARLFFFRGGRYGSAFEVVPVRREGGSKDAPLKAAGRPLALAAPYYRWFDATEVVRGWAGAGQRQGLLLLRKAPAFTEGQTYLEIAYEGQLESPPKQVSQVKAFCRAGQVFITFREIEDYDTAKDKMTWGELAGRFQGLDYGGPVPRDEPREVRYRVYTHDKPITAATIGQSELLAEVVPGSGYNTRRVPAGDFSHQRPKAVAMRLAVEAEKPLPAGTGLYVHTVGRHGQRHYAVVSAVNGVENTVDISPANVVGPIQQRPAAPEPVLQMDNTTEVRGGTYHEQWYSFWAAEPLAPRPLRYDLAVGSCPDTMARPAPLHVTRGHTWGDGPEMPGPGPRHEVVMSHSAEGPYNGIWTGVNDAEFTLKGIEQGRWQPFVQRRQEALIRWIQANWPIDPQRISSGVGAWGLWELRRGELYACINGWGMPEVTKGFQLWHWSQAVWGTPEVYKDKPDQENPWVLQDYSRFVLANPETELPYFNIHTGWGMHSTEMGWPPWPRFIRAMIETKRAFCMHSRAVEAAMQKGLISIRRDQSLPAFGNCSLDDNIGDGELGSGRAFGQVNGHLVWESATIVDEPGVYAITVYLWDTAPLPECTVDLTPRRCRRFTAKPGEKFLWRNTTAADGKVVQSGEAPADKLGLVTLPKLKVTKAKHRIWISRK
ncbi:MAG: hypothetical protein AMJ81_06045 [Phycisphaerae bacterium SM23_33]|nr:MAG: hypothetical protein AMJ81_06045 [Phycisphaerae bacterium SM23_33]